MTTVAIVGSRDHHPDADIDRALVKLKASYPDLTIITGDAHGVDEMVAEMAELAGLRPIVEVAHWPRLGRAAGSERNHRIVARADMLIAFFHPKPLETLSRTSPGTTNCINAAMSKGIPVHIRWRDQWLKREDIG